jgi:sec-independent protein translocase protein TatA
MPFSVGPMELVLVLAIALIVLGPKRLPEAGRALGKGMREFKDSVSGLGSHDDDDEEEGEPSKLKADGTAAPH